MRKVFLITFYVAIISFGIISFIYINEIKSVLGFSTQNSPEKTGEMPLLIISYLPVEETNSSRLSRIITGEVTLSSKKEQIKKFVDETTDFLNEISVSKSNPPSYLHYFPINEKYPHEIGFVDLYKETPYDLGDPVYCKNDSHGETDCLPDYEKILGDPIEKSDLERVTGHDVCYYVDKLGVKEIWIYSYHGHYSVIAKEKLNFISGHGKYELDLITFAVTLGKRSKHFVSDNKFGVFSNKELWWRERENFLPVCKNTYTLVGYEYDEAIGTFFRDHTHQFRNVFLWVDSAMAQKYFADCLSAPPYSKEKYLECTKNIPGEGNDLYIEGKKVINWWEFVADFDGALERYGRSFLNGQPL